MAALAAEIFCWAWRVFWAVGRVRFGQSYSRIGGNGPRSLEIQLIHHDSEATALLRLPSGNAVSWGLVPEGPTGPGEAI